MVLEGDEGAIRHFFFERFDSMLRVLVAKAFGSRLYSFDDCRQDFFLFLSADGYRRLRSYDTSMPLAPWLSVIAYRFFRDCAKKQIDLVSDEPIYSKQDLHSTAMDSFVVHSSFIMDLTSALDALPSQRDAAILRSLLIDGEEPAAVAKAHDITVDNLYNIKRRTVARLSATYLHDYAAERGVL